MQMKISRSRLNGIFVVSLAALWSG